MCGRCNIVFHRSVRLRTCIRLRFCDSQSWHVLLSMLLEEDRQTGNAEQAIVCFDLTGVSISTWTGEPQRQSLTASLDNHLLDAQSQTFLLQQGQHSEDNQEIK